MAGHWTTFMALITATVALASCWRGDATTSRKDASNGAVSQGPTCEADSLRPSTAAPAEGLWLAEESSQARRVAVMVGPGRAIEGDLRVLRRLEAIEVGTGGDTLRNETNGATVHLELLPARSAETLGMAASDTAHAHQPVATYAVGSTVIVAAYEVCTTGVTSPRLRYLRLDSRGRVATDVMLQRVSTGWLRRDTALEGGTTGTARNALRRFRTVTADARPRRKDGMEPCRTIALLADPLAKPVPSRCNPTMGQA